MTQNSLADLQSHAVSFVGLGPAVALIVPLAATGAVRLSGTVRPRYYALIGGILFALAATPGPVAHDLVVGRGTWLANKVTAVLGGPVVAATAPRTWPGSRPPGCSRSRPASWPGAGKASARPFRWPPQAPRAG